ncbi:transcriptional repressor [Empedobacter sp. GD03644]|uniref:Fur family transcriptional regulator n=1 Tax=unclassified Empedobacter TaxID=2643773 RepID=UPI0024491825|nr:MULTISPECIES: transcriptional repressor [unclassified Empedobacter]MDH2207223.1 transcriptional repressor [Empedobacter sp. GD03644]
MQTEILNKTLQNRSINPTAMRLLVLDKLMNAEVALSLADLEIEMDQADRVTIYRTLKTFEENKLIHSIEDGTGSIKYALCESSCKCTPEFTHAHFHCNNCNQTFCLRNIHVPEINLPKNFEAEQSSFILKGICDQCKS